MGIGDVDSLLDGRLFSHDWQKAAFTGQGSGFYHSPLYVAGLPGAGALPSAGVNGAAVANGRSGTILAPAAVANKSSELHTVDFSAVSNIGSAFLVDRMWENSGLSMTVTTSQSIPSPAALPPRDVNKSANGLGVWFAIEVTANLGAATATATLTYTDSDGNPGATAVVTVPTSCVAGTLLFFPWASGDYGVRVPTAFQLSASLLSGSLSLVGGRRLGRKLRATANSVPDSFGPADGGHPIPDGCAPQFVYLLTGTAAGASDGTVQFTQA